MEKGKCHVSCLFVFSWKIPKIKIFHMAAKKHPEVIEGRRQLIYVDVIDSEEEAEDAAIDYDDAALDEEYGSGLVGEDVTEEVRDIQKALKSSSLSSYMLKPSHLPAHTFGKSRTALEQPFKHMCNFGSQAEWREGRIFVSSYIDVETTKDQCRLLNPAPLGYIAGYIMDDAVGERDLKCLP